MKPEKMTIVQAEIHAVVTRHGISRWAFCGQDKNRMFVGFFEPAKLTQGEAMLNVINVGRLWQYARQTCRGLLDSFERMP